MNEEKRDLLEVLGAEAGELVSVGRFGIDGEKARDKLRLYQLADPRAWVLLVVEAVVLAGTTSVRFEFDADDVRIDCEGARLGAAELDNLLAALFVGIDEQATAAERLRARVRQQLAFAINAALALEPRFVRFSSGPSAAELAAAERAHAQAERAWTEAQRARARAELTQLEAELARRPIDADAARLVEPHASAPREPPSKPIVLGHRLELRPNAPDQLDSAPLTGDLQVHVRARIGPGALLPASEALLDAVARREQARLGHHPLRALRRAWLHLIANPRSLLRALDFSEAVIDECLARSRAAQPALAKAARRRTRASSPESGRRLL